MAPLAQTPLKPKSRCWSCRFPPLPARALACQPAASLLALALSDDMACVAQGAGEPVRKLTKNLRHVRGTRVAKAVEGQPQVLYRRVVAQRLGQLARSLCLPASHVPHSHSILVSAVLPPSTGKLDVGKTGAKRGREGGKGERERRRT